MVKKKKDETDEILNELEQEYDEAEQFDEAVFDDIGIGGEKEIDGHTIQDSTFEDYDTKMLDAESLKVFLETETFLNRIRLGLENKEKRSFKDTNHADGKTKTISIVKQIPGTKPLANSEGISQIMARTQSVISKDVSLGNIDWLRYDKYMLKFKQNFITQLVIHAKDWNIKPSKIKPVYDIVSDAVMLYLTRPVGDRERGIFGGKDQNIQQHQQEQPKGLGKKITNMFRKKKGMGDY